MIDSAQWAVICIAAATIINAAAIYVLNKKFINIVNATAKLIREQEHVKSQIVLLTARLDCLYQSLLKELKEPKPKHD